MKPRIGFGFDVHQLTENRDFFLGGIKIPHTKGALGHSDADALIHAVCDALLGAANLGDIGKHFPDTSAKYKNIDSKILLKEVVKLLEEKKYSIGNIDITVCLQKPKIAQYISEMKKTMADVMQITEADLSIKATTTEKLGFTGREEGIAVYAVAIIF
ncbi:MAG TPA: 2-C-methyl-D-erythritol 2,4-cyclodiphosphate synthase [Bacteroidales bacterium]|nr:2-C-methyl-D-erythritol 2,4-cyclodiphosphate synthase [Bacteroidales bacterium]HPS16963.1 2-C-methyl-D-erythritol 2,4-cyclodiphosphate synthase [Bacteroidales bacterium]